VPLLYKLRLLELDSIHLLLSLTELFPRPYRLLLLRSELCVACARLLLKVLELLLQALNQVVLVAL